MAKRNSASVTTNETQELRREFAELKDHLRVLIDVLDGVREELQWLTRNGLPLQERHLPASPVLKRMALDPAVGDWNEQLEIVRGDEGASEEGSEKAPTPISPRPPAGQLFSKPGDQARLF